jgi:hypothetical protein
MSEVGQNEKVSQRAFLDRCTPESGHCSARLPRQKGANFRREHVQQRARKEPGPSRSSSAATSSLSGNFQAEHLRRLSA